MSGRSACHVARDYHALARYLPDFRYGRAAKGVGRVNSSELEKGRLADCCSAANASWTPISVGHPTQYSYRIYCFQVPTHTKGRSGRSAFHVAIDYHALAHYLPDFRYGRAAKGVGIVNSSELEKGRLADCCSAAT